VTKTRRVVTGHNKTAKCVKWDTAIESKPGRERFEKTDLWATDSLPAHLPKTIQPYGRTWEPV